jgi:hypothetical protein
MPGTSLRPLDVSRRPGGVDLLANQLRRIVHGMRA